MSDRETAARALAERMGWKYVRDTEGYSISGVFVRTDGPFIMVPAPDAPLHEKLAFVGRLAEAVGANAVAIDSWSEDGWGVFFYPEEEEEPWFPHKSPDLVLAALLAATAAKEGGS